MDPALEFATEINAFVFEAFLILFERTAFNIVLHFWMDKIPIITVIFFHEVGDLLVNFAFTCRPTKYEVSDQVLRGCSTSLTCGTTEVCCFLGAEGSHLPMTDV